MDQSCHVKTLNMGFFPYGRPKCECQKPLPYTHVWSELSCRCEKVFGLVNPAVPFSCSCKLTESVWSVSVEPGNASGGWLGHYRWTRKKVCFLTLVNQVNGPLGGRSRVPNGLIREEEVDDGNEQQREGHGLTHLQPSTSAAAPRPAKDTQISREPAWSHIFCRLNIRSGFKRTAVKCEFHVTVV